MFFSSMSHSEMDDVFRNGSEFLTINGDRSSRSDSKGLYSSRFHQRSRCSIESRLVFVSSHQIENSSSLNKKVHKIIVDSHVSDVHFYHDIFSHHSKMSSIQYTRVSNSTPVVKENETKPTLISRPKRVIEKTLIPVEVTSTLYDIIKNKNNDVKRYITMDVKKIFSENSNLDPSVIYDSLIDVETIVDTFITFQTSEIQKEKIEKEKIKVELRSKGYVPYTPIGFYPDIPKRRVDAISVDLEKLRTSDLRAKAESMRNHIQKLKNKKPIFLLSFDEMEKLYPGSVSKNTFDRANLFRDEYVRWSIEVLENELKAFTEKNRDQLQSHLLDSLKSSSKRAIDHDEQIGRKDRRTLVFPDIYGKTLCRTKEERQAIKETESYFRTSDRKVDREPLSGKLENPSGVTINDVINNELYDFVSEILIRERDVAIELYKSKLSQEEKNIYESELHMKSSVHNKIYGLLWKLTKNELKKRENIQIDPNWNEEYERQNMIHSEMMRAKMKHDVLRIVSGGISIGLNMYFYSKIGFPFDSFLSVMSDNTTVYSLPLYCAAWVLVPLLRAEISQTMTIWTQHLAKKGYGLIVPDRFRIELDGDSDVNSDPTKRRTGRLIYTSSKDVGQLDQLFVRMKVKNEYVGTKNMWGISSTFKGTYPYRIVTAMRDIVMYPVSCNPVLFVCSSITSIAAYCMSTAVMSFLLREDNRKLVYDVFRGVAGFVWTKETSRLTDMFTDMRTNPAVWRLLASWMITSIGARKWTEGLGKSVTEKMENLTWFKDPLFSEEVAVKIESAMAKKPDWINYSLAQMTGGIATILSNALLNEVGGMSMGALCNDGVNLISSLGDSQAMELWTVSVSGNINKAMMNFMENYVNNEKMKSYETGEQVEKGMLNFGKEISQMMKNQVYKGMNDLRDIVHMTAEVTCTAVETISYDLFGIKTEADLEDINEWRRTMYDVTKTPAERASALKNWQRKYNPDDERAYSERIDDIKAETKFRDDLQTIADKTKELLSSSNPKLEEIKPLFESFKKTGNELEELLNSKGPQNPLVKIDPNSVRGMWGQIQDPSIKTGTGVDIEPNATKIAVAIADAERWIKVGEGFKGKHVYPLVGDITKSIIRNGTILFYSI